MAGTEVPPSVCEISNALANGQDKTEPSQKRRRKSGGNGADAHRDDALDRSGQDQLEEEDRGTLGARAEASDKVGNPSRQGRGKSATLSSDTDADGADAAGKGGGGEGKGEGGKRGEEEKEGKHPGGNHDEEEAEEEQEEGEEEEEEEEEEAEEEEEDDEEEMGEEGGGGGGGEEGATGGLEGSEQASAATGDAAGKSDGKKIARARSAWMLFLADNREKVREVNPGLPIGPMQKILSEMWKGLSEDETARYTKLAAEDKERMKKELEAVGLTRLPAKDSGSAAAAPGGPTSLVLPLARVRKTVRLDPGVGNISKEGLLLVTKATEVFMAMMADKSWHIGRQTGRKSVRPCDVADFVFAAPEMYWLRDEFRQDRSSVKKKNKPEAAKKVAAATKIGVPKGATPITSFFQKKA